MDDQEAEESQTADIESILSMFLSQGASESMLRWHYRSRHDSLINVSNQEFYDGKLMVFQRSLKKTKDIVYSVLQTLIKDGIVSMEDDRIIIKE